MKKYIIQRLLQLIPVLILVSIFSFIIINAAPGEAIQNYIRPGMSPEDIENLRIQYGVDGSLVKQYFGWLGRLLQGDLGMSIYKNQPVVDLLADRLPYTVMLMGASLIISIVCAIPLGLIAGLNKNKPIDMGISFFSYLGISVPQFWLAMVFIIIFAMKLNILPSGGMRTPGVETTVDLFKYMIMPAVVLSFNNMAIYIRYIRSNTINQLEEDYVLTAVSKGTKNKDILTRHVLKNTMMPIITLLGINIAGLVVGSFVIESVFSWPGIGRLAMDAVQSRDYPLIMGYTMFSCFVLILGNFMADVLYAVIDPRIRQGVRMRDGN